MPEVNGQIRLVVSADDFGKNPSTNAAVLKAHHEGILTTAGLMVNEDGAKESVKIAQENPRLGIGLHLVLLFDKPALPPSSIPDLIDTDGKLKKNAVGSGFNCYFRKRLKSQLKAEIKAQVAKFKETGLNLDHINGHLHFHLHPVVFNIILENAQDWGVKAIRLMHEPLFLNLRIAKGRYFMRITEAITFKLLSSWCKNKLRQRGIKYTDRVFGLLQNKKVDSEYLKKLLKVLPNGVSEIYSHPSVDEFPDELDALVNPEVRKIICERQIKLIRYKEI